MTAVEGSLAISRAHRDLGVGKVVEADESRVTLEWFESVADPAAHCETVPTSDLIPWVPGRQCRVYFRNGTRWRVGRVLDEEIGRFLVRPPGGDDDVWLPIEDLYVRWDRPLSDPVAVMQSLGMESPHHYYGRHKYVESMLEQNAACGGMAALPSSAVEIYDHQVEVATRVLSDPIQRYLLADEVGLGKTIEAGYIIRQRLLDDPECHVRLVVPQRIRRQWEAELRDRFFTDDFILSYVDVRSLEDSSAWSTGDGELSPDLVVIDEAHHIAGWAHGPRALRDRYAAASAVAHAAPSLLLLSATPVAHHEETFLAMLHLLDPDNYRLEDGKSFRRRVADRHELSRAMVLFRAGQRLRRMAANADRLRALVAGDPDVLALLDSILASPAEESREELDGRIRALRSALSERHRIHHRMLRHRRDDVRDFPVRGRKLSERLEVTSPANDRLDAWIDRWKNALVEDAANLRAAAGLFSIFMDRALGFPSILAGFVEERSGSGRGTDAELTPVDLDLLAAAPVREAEREVLGAFNRISLQELEDHRVQTVVDHVFAIPRRSKVVVFATYTATAQLLADALTARLAPGQVAMHLSSMDLDETRAQLRTFREERPCNVLVCDASAEEGLNLQFADVLLHAELPFSPNRVEQRVGRLDRHGPTEPVRNVLVIDSADSETHLNSWARCLSEGFAVFGRSIATYQFVVDLVMPDAASRLLEGGAAALDELVAQLPDRLDAERTELREQDQLDAIETVDLRQPVAAGIRDCDEDWEEIEGALEGLISAGKGHLRFARVGDYRDERLCTYWASHPIRGGEPLVAQSDLVDYMLGTYSEPDRQLLGSFDRSLALRYPGSRVWRVGDRFLDGLLRYARERDDRGRAYALWRVAPDFEADEALAALRFDFIIEPEIPEGDAADTRAMRRRAIETLQPWFETVWVTPDLAEQESIALQKRLAAKYSPAFGDERLGVDRWDGVGVALRGIEWEQWCGEARAVAETVVRGRTSVQERTSAAAERARAASNARLGALRGRDQLVHDVDATLRWEERCALELPEAVGRPRLVLDSMGLVVLAGRSRRDFV